MTTYVVDASVVIKWLQPQLGAEQDADLAVQLLVAYRRGAVSFVQPVHWLCEVAAVLARISPTAARQDLMDLVAFGVPVADAPEIYRTAIDLAIALNHHLFDTLYHAVALHVQGGILVTADSRYFAKARHRGRIQRLGDLIPVPIQK